LVQFLFIVVDVREVQAQWFTKWYDNNIAGPFDYPESYIIERFRPTSNYNFDGTIMVKSYLNPYTHRPVEITLTDDNGVVIKSRTCFDNSVWPVPLHEYVPVSAAYNPITKHYAIIGTKKTSYAVGLTYDSWFIFLDEDLNLINTEFINCSVPGISPSGLILTDICSIQNGPLSATNGGFAYTGLNTNFLNPSPNVNTTLDKHLVAGQCYYDPSSNDYIFPTTGFNYFDWGVPEFNNAIFPSRMIEIPLSGNNGGFIITGTGPNDINANAVGSIFFARLDYNLDMSAAEFYPPLNPAFGEKIHAGDLYFDPVQEEVWFAGTNEMENGNRALLYQKLVNLNNPGIQIYPNLNGSTILAGPYNFYQMNLFTDNGKLKVCKIMPSNDPEKGVIGATFFENNRYTSWNNTTTYPFLTYVLFSDAELNNIFFQNQTDFAYTYPRLMGNIGIGNFFPFLDFQHLHYPSHTMHEMPLSSFPDESYMMGSTLKHAYAPTNYNEMNVLIRTENYHQNDCINIEEPIIRTNFVADNFSLAPSTIFAPTIMHFPVDYLTNDFPIESNDCATQGQGFKQNVSDISNNIIPIGQPFKIPEEFIINGYFIFNSSGQRIFESTANNSFIPDVSSWPKGIYFIKKKSTSDNPSQIIKFSL
jgi:hypothetical protein